MAKEMSSWLERCLYQFPLSLLSQLAGITGVTGQTSKTNKGSIFIIVLWSLFFLTSLALAVNAYIWPQLSVAANLKDRTVLHYLAKAGIKRAILEIDKDTTDSYDALKDSWSNNEDGFKEIELGDGFFSIKYQIPNSKAGAEDIRYGLVDEERKININKASYSVLKIFFEIVTQVTSQEASDIAASIIDWRDEDDKPQDNGAESGYYLTLEQGYPCKNKDFEVLEELLLVKGMTQEIFDRIKDRITIFGIGAVNINTADELVLCSLGMTQDLAEKIIHFRNGSDGREATSDDNVFESTATIAQTSSNKEALSREETSQLNSIIGGGLFSVRSENFRLESFGKFKHRDISRKIVVVFNRNKVIKYWREE